MGKIAEIEYQGGSVIVHELIGENVRPPTIATEYLPRLTEGEESTTPNLYFVNNAIAEIQMGTTDFTQVQAHLLINREGKKTLSLRTSHNYTNHYTEPDICRITAVTDETGLEVLRFTIPAPIEEPLKKGRLAGILSYHQINDGVQRLIDNRFPDFCVPNISELAMEAAEQYTRERQNTNSAYFGFELRRTADGYVLSPLTVQGSRQQRITLNTRYVKDAQIVSYLPPTAQYQFPYPEEAIKVFESMGYEVIIEQRDGAVPLAESEAAAYDLLRYVDSDHFSTVYALFKSRPTSSAEYAQLTDELHTVPIGRIYRDMAYFGARSVEVVRVQDVRGGTGAYKNLFHLMEAVLPNPRIDRNSLKPLETYNQEIGQFFARRLVMWMREHHDEFATESMIELLENTIGQDCDTPLNLEILRRVMVDYWRINGRSEMTEADIRDYFTLLAEIATETTTIQSLKYPLAPGDIEGYTVEDLPIILPIVTTWVVDINRMMIEYVNEEKRLRGEIKAPAERKKKMAELQKQMHDVTLALGDFCKRVIGFQIQSDSGENIRYEMGFVDNLFKREYKFVAPDQKIQYRGQLKQYISEKVDLAATFTTVYTENIHPWMLIIYRMRGVLWTQERQYMPNSQTVTSDDTSALDLLTGELRDRGAKIMSNPGKVRARMRRRIQNADRGDRGGRD